jgi:hypothetical protein
MSKRKSPRLLGFVSGALAAGALLIGIPTGTASASEPATTAEARQMAQDSLVRAEQYRALGGVAYKNGLVQREEAAAVRYDALADQFQAAEPTVAVTIISSPQLDMKAVGIAVVPPAPPVTSPEVEHYAALAAHYRFIGGAAYKTGRVQAAEAAQRDAEAALQPAAVAPAPEQPNPICMADKPAVTPECLTE